MAGLTITEFEWMAPTGPNRDGIAQIPMQPPVTVQTALVPGASSAQSQAFNAATRFVELTTDADCRINFGSNPTAAQSNSLMKAGDVRYYGVRAGDKLAVIANV